jgi:tetratricopeptide (TPR) repeat protein
MINFEIKYFKIFIIVLILLFQPLIKVVSQDIDSLESILNNKKGLEKLQILNKLAESYKSLSFDKSYKYANQAIILSVALNDKAEEGKALHTLGVLFYFKGDFDKTLYYWEKALKARQAGNDKIGVANSLNNIGLIYLNKGNYDKALEFYQKSFEMQKDLDNKKGMAGALENIGIVYQNRGFYDKAISYFQQSLKIEEELNNNLGVSQSLNSIAGVYFLMNNYEKALQYYQQSLSIKEKLGDIKEVAFTLNNIGNVYDNLLNYSKAIEYYEKSLSISLKIGLTQNLANIYNNLGNIYIKQKKYNKASEFFQKALLIHQNSGNLQGISSCYFHFATINYHNGQYKKALEYSQKSLNISKKIGLKDHIKRNYQLQASIYAAINDYENAYYLHQKYVDIKDSLINEESHKQITEIEAKYQTEKKEKEIAFLNQQSELNNLKLKKNAKEIQFQRTIIYIAIIGFVLILFFLLLLYKQFLEKKAINLKLEVKNNEISIQNIEIERQKNLAISQRDQITEQKKHITDSILYAKKIQHSILPDDKCIRKFFDEYFIYYQPKDIVSGDFYWFSITGMPKKAITIAAIDCTGHGVPGALMSIVGYNLLNQIIKLQNKVKPDEILNLLTLSLSNLLQTSTNQQVVNDSLDIALCTIYPDEMCLEYAGAHNPVYIIQNGNLLELKGNSISIGEKYNDSYINYDLKKININSGDIIYLFSDGYIDQFGGKERKKFLSKRFKNLIIDIQHLSMKEQKKALINNFENWKMDVEQYDDVMILGFKIPDKLSADKEVIIEYKGIIDIEKIEDLISKTKEKLQNVELKNQVKKKTINILVECLENIQKYSSDKDIENNYLPEVSVFYNNDFLTIESKNPIDKSNIEKLEKHIELVNNYDKENLKKLYEEVISNGNLSEKGGAGLGLIDIALKSNNKIEYSFSEIDSELYYFKLKILINTIN